MPLTERLKKLDLSIQILLGLFLGILTGLFFGESAQVIGWIGEAWIRLMQMAVIPYVTLSLISGVGSLDMKLAKLLAIRGTLLLFLFWFISALVLVAMPMAFPSWVDASFLSHNQITSAQAFDPIELYVPDNPFYSLANGMVPAVVVFSIILGIALINTKNRYNLLSSFEVVIEALTHVMKFIMRLTPIGVFSIVAVAAGTLTMEELAQLEVYFSVYAVASILLTFGIIPMVISMFTSFSYADVMRFSRSALLTGFVTQNILVTLPLLICKSNELFEKYQMNSDQNKHVVDVIIPVIFNFPLTGRLLALLFIPFAAWMSGSSLELSHYPSLIVTGIFSLFAKAQVALNFLMDMFYIPHDLLNLYLPSSILNGKFDAMVSVMNLFAFSLIITVSISGQLKIRMSRILRYGGASLVLLMTTVLGTKFLLGMVTEQTYNKDKLLMNMQPAEFQMKSLHVFDDLPDAPRIMSDRTSDDLLQQIIKDGVLRVGYRAERVPLSFFNNDAQLVGLDVDLFNRLGEELGVRVEYYPFDWNNFFDLLNERYLDVVPAVSFSTYNLLKVDLSQPYLKGKLSFITKDFRRHDFTSLEVLKQHESISLAMLGDAEYIDNLKRRIKRLIPGTQINIVPVENYNEFFEMGNNVDALIESAEVGAGLTLLHPDYSVMTLPDVEMSFPMSYAVPKGEKAFAEFLSNWLAAKQATGRIDFLRDYWIYGEGSKVGKRRWSIREDVLGW
jgi:Na+/H+-dicarboxylate symporter/ABC-type amino acid transport substrate-binding protein